MPPTVHRYTAVYRRPHTGGRVSHEFTLILSECVSLCASRHARRRSREQLAIRAISDITIIIIAIAVVPVLLAQIRINLGAAVITRVLLAAVAMVVRVHVMQQRLSSGPVLVLVHVTILLVLRECQSHASVRPRRSSVEQAVRVQGTTQLLQALLLKALMG